VLYAFIGALLIGVSLGLFGSGGSILTVPVLVYLLHHPDKAAIAESLGIVGGIALLGAIPYARASLVDWRSVVFFGVPGMVGTFAGAWIARYVPGSLQLLLFALVMLFAAWMMWRRSGGAVPSTGESPDAEVPETSPPPRRHVGKIIMDGLVVGVVTGLVGVGGGFMIVPALILLGGLEMRVAVGTSLAIIAMKSAAGFLKYLDVLADFELAVDWTIVGLFIVVGVVGTFAGNAVGKKVDQRALKRGFSIFLLVMAAFILYREAPGALDFGGGAAGEDESTPPAMETEAADG
jgi:uncharacterized membrane protein YfcA